MFLYLVIDFYVMMCIGLDTLKFFIELDLNQVSMRIQVMKYTK